MEKTPYLALKTISFSTSYDVAISGNPISNYFFAWVSIRRTDIPSPMNQYRTEEDNGKRFIWDVNNQAMNSQCYYNDKDHQNYW